MTRVGRSAAQLVACAAIAAVALDGAASTGEGPAISAADLVTVSASLERGAFTEAITQLELWSDQGVVHPDLSFDRGVAYLGRAESPARRRADFGQAIAAFEEAASLDPSDEEAQVIVERIRTSLTERRVKRDGVVARPRLMRALLDLVGENVWAGLGLVGALALTLGLSVRLWAQSHRARLSGGIAAVVGFACAALGAGMAFAGHRLRLQASPAVVIVEEARLQDAEGHPFSGARGASTLGEASDRVPEGTLVHVSGTRGALVQIEWGDSEAWLDGREVRRLAVAPSGVID